MGPCGSDFLLADDVDIAMSILCSKNYDQRKNLGNIIAIFTENLPIKI